VQYIQLPHRGTSATRNAGLDRLKGEYWCNLDADNLMKPGYISEMVKALESASSPPLDFVYCQREYFGSTSLEGTCSQFPEFNLSAFKVRNFVDLNCIMVRADSSRNLRFDPTLSRWVDFDFFLSFLEQGAQCKRVDKALVLYRRHGDAITSQITNSSRRQMMRWFMKKHGDFYSQEEKRAFRAGIQNSMIRYVLAVRGKEQSFWERVLGGIELIQARASVSECLAQLSYTLLPKAYRIRVLKEG